jgi:hypothetical protein
MKITQFITFFLCLFTLNSFSMNEQNNKQETKLTNLQKEEIDVQIQIHLATQDTTRINNPEERKKMERNIIETAFSRMNATNTNKK